MDETQGVYAESPPAPEAPTAPAPSAPGVDPGFGFDPQQQHVPYTRFKEVNDRYNQDRQQWAQEREYYARLAQQQAQPQRPAAPGVTLNNDEMQAGEALSRLLEHHPKLQMLHRMMQVAPQLAQGYGQVNQLSQRYQQAVLAGGQQEVRRLATSAQLPATPEHIQYYEGLVAETIRRMPDGMQRWSNGDLGVVQDAWKGVQTFLSGFQRQAGQQSVRAHQNIQNLPPRMRGSAPGAPLPPKLGPDDDGRDFIRKMHSDAARVIGSGQTG